MKYLIIMSLLIFLMLGISQAPQRINFQSVLRNTTGEVISNSSVSLRISILRGTTTGTLVYSETHAKMTDAGGLMSLQIGNGTAPSRDFASIDWGGSAHFIKLEADFSGGNNYILLGTQELMSVPYALYASKTDTSVLNLASRFSPLNNKLNIVDTSTMLLNYRTGLNNKLNIIDTSTMLLNYKTGLNNKLNIMDTSTMLLNYKTELSSKVNNADTSDMLNPYLRKADAVVSVETDPVFNASVAKGITVMDTAYWNRKTGNITGDIQYWNGTSWVNLAPGAEGHVLKIVSGKPEWGSVTTSAVLAGTASSTPTLTVYTALTNITHATLGATGIGTASSLPTGVSASWFGNVLTISGTPSTAGTFNYTIPLTGTGCTSLNATGTITVVSTATLTTTAVSKISPTAASSGGNISLGGVATVSARGLVYNTSTNPTLSNTLLTIGSGTGSFSGTLTGLSPNTTYYIRAYATNSVGTAYGNEVSFTTIQTVTDIDGNIYNTVQIGNQVWMSENLKTSRYRNGGLIPYVTDNTAWGNYTGAWSYYNNDVSNNAIYGKLYNWYATLGDTLCPTGWGVPTDAEWTTLTDSLGGASVAGGKMKTIGNAYWNTQKEATNVSGFSALPGGYRNFDGSFIVLGIVAFFWSATEFDYSNAWYCALNGGSGSVYRASSSKSFGASVRCLRD